MINKIKFFLYKNLFLLVNFIAKPLLDSIAFLSKRMVELEKNG